MKPRPANTEPAPVLELSVPPDGRFPERTLTVRFGDFLSGLLSAPEPGVPEPLTAGIDAPGEAGTDTEGGEPYGRLQNLSAGADFLHCIFSGGPSLDGRPEGPDSLASYVLSLTDAALDAAHDILYYEPDYEYGHHGIPHPDPKADHLARMMRLTDHLDPDGHAFGSVLSAILAAPPAEDPGASSGLAAALAAATTETSVEAAATGPSPLPEQASAPPARGGGPDAEEAA